MEKRITSEKICETKSYNGVDIVKLICAFFVCIIHIPIFPSKTAGLSFFEQDGYGLANFFLAQGICRIAVPFFFVATGFFFFRKTAESTIDRSAVEKYCFKLFRLIGIWMFLLFVGKTDHMWYLFASILGVILLSFCIYKKIKFRYLIIIACLLYAIGLLGDLYYGLITPIRNVKLFDYAIELYEKVFFSTRNGIFMGFIFILIGAMFAYKKIKIPMVVAIIGFVLSMATHYLELFLTSFASLPRDYNMSVSLPIAAFFLFYIAINIRLPDRPIYKRLRAIGVLIFYMHFMVEWLTRLAFEIVFKFTETDLLPQLFPTVICIVVALSVLIEWLSRKEKLAFLKYLYE